MIMVALFQGGGAQRYEEELKKIYGMDGTMSGTAGGFQVQLKQLLSHNWRTIFIYPTIL